MRSFGDAIRGVVLIVRSEPNARIHLAVTFGVVGLGLYLGLDAVEWAAVTLAFAVVWSAEAFNTALERLADAVSPERHPLVGEAKDIAAGAVLLAAAGAAFVGAIVLGRRVIELLR